MLVVVSCQRVAEAHATLGIHRGYLEAGALGLQDSVQASTSASMRVPFSARYRNSTIVTAETRIGSPKAVTASSRSRVESASLDEPCRYHKNTWVSATTGPDTLTARGSQIAPDLMPYPRNVVRRDVRKPTGQGTVHVAPHRAGMDRHVHVLARRQRKPPHGLRRNHQITGLRHHGLDLGLRLAAAHATSSRRMTEE